MGQVEDAWVLQKQVWQTRFINGKTKESRLKSVWGGIAIVVRLLKRLWDMIILATNYPRVMMFALARDTEIPKPGYSFPRMMGLDVSSCGSHASYGKSCTRWDPSFRGRDFPEKHPQPVHYRRDL